MERSLFVLETVLVFIPFAAVNVILHIGYHAVIQHHIEKTGFFVVAS